MFEALKQKHPHIEVELKHRYGHPYLEGAYAHGGVRKIPVLNKDAQSVLQDCHFLRDQWGLHQKTFKNGGFVHKQAKSIQGEWSPFNNY